MANERVDELLTVYRKGDRASQPAKLNFEGVGNCDVYNPTAVFEYGKERMICARVEKRESEQSEAVFFKETAPDYFVPAPEFQRYQLQDPFLTKLAGGYLFGGTEIFPDPDHPGALGWHTRFYFGKTLETLADLAVGPDGMKDIRLVELKDHRIGVFTRPQGEKGGRGKIGFTILKKLEELTKERLESAPLLPLFGDEEWGGVNEPVLLEDGRIGVLGHIAKFSEGDVRHYYCMSFLFDPETRQITGWKVIAERADFLEGPYKRPDLIDVLFSGGLVREEKFALLYVGVSDCEVQRIQIADPFYESLKTV